jgi:hypothetical protein
MPCLRLWAMAHGRDELFRERLRDTGQDRCSGSTYMMALLTAPLDERSLPRLCLLICPRRGRARLTARLPRFMPSIHTTPNAATGRRQGFSPG